MAPPPPPPPPPPPIPDDLGFDAVLDGMSNGKPESAGLPSFAAESNGMGSTSTALVKAPETKSWEKPLTIPEIRKSSNNWSLASDAGLLLYLQEFSQKMMTKTSDLEKRMDSLVQDAKSADSRVHNTFNDFLMLANTQFIENRVYDDSEDVDGNSSGDKDKKDNQTKSREQREAEVIPRVIQALTLGINVLDTGFEHLDANAGNSDSDDEDPTYKAVDPILEAKDLYAHRSLPYIIGTPAFMQDDDVGLMELSEEEVDDDSSQDDTLSDSDKSELSDSDYTDTETESDFTGGQQRLLADTTATSTYKSGTDDSDTDLFDEDEPSGPQMGTQQPINFQDELAAKLGGPGAGAGARGAMSAEQGESIDEASRNRTISETSKTSSQEGSKKATRRKKLPLDREKKSKKKRSPSKAEDDGLFAGQGDQEEPDDSPFSKSGLFSSSGGGLFDDDREEEGGLFDDKPSAVRREVTSDHVYEDIVAHPEESKPVKKGPPGGVPMFGAAQEDELFGGSTKRGQEGESNKSGQSGGLFDGQEEDALFADSGKALPKKAAAKPKPKKQVDLFGEGEGSDLFGETKSQQPPPKKKIPAGAVNVLGASTPLGGQTEPPPLEDDDDVYVNNLVGAPGGGRGKHAPLGGSLFDNVDEDLFGTPPPRPSEKPAAKNDTDKLFADDNDDDLFAAPPPLPKDDSKSSAKKNQGLFDDIEETGEDDLFAASSKPKETSKKKPPGGVALFEGADIFGSPPKAEEESPVQKKPEMSPQAKANRTQNTLSLFHDEEDRDEELFTPAPAPPPKKDQLEPTSKEEQMARRRTKSKSIFDDEAILFGLKNEENPGVDLFGSDTPISKNESEKDSKSSSSTPRKRASSASKGLFGEDEEEEDDLFSSTASKSATTPRSSGVKAAVAKEKKKKKAAPKSGGLFGEEEDDDLFGESKGKKKSERKKEEKKKEEEKEEEKAAAAAPVPTIKVDDPLGGVKESAEDTPPPPPKEDPPLLPPSKKPPAGAVSMFGGIDPASITKNRSPSQIDEEFEKANMNIDPTALKPGAAPPSREAEASSVGFDQPATAKTLANPTKTRAKISAKRRPPSRRSLHAAAAAASESNQNLWGDDGADRVQGSNTFTSNMASDEPDLGAAAAPPVSRSPPQPVKKKPAGERSPPPAAKPKKKIVTSDNLFENDLFSNSSNTSGPASLASSGTRVQKEERPFSIEGESELFAEKSKADKKTPSRTVDPSDENLFAKPPQGSLDASVDDIFAAPPVGQSSKQSSVDKDPIYEDIFASSPGKSKRSTLTDLAIDEDLFGASKPTGDIGIDEDLFGIPSAPAATTATTTKAKKKKPVKKVSALEDDDDLFGEKPKKTKTKAAKATDADLFGDSDIFADLPAAKPKEKKKKAKAKAAAEGDIFQDVRGDDIFADPPTSSKPKKTKAKKKTVKEASDSIFDTEGPSIFDDPLNAMNK